MAIAESRGTRSLTRGEFLGAAAGLVAGVATGCSSSPSNEPIPNATDTSRPPYPLPRFTPQPEQLIWTAIDNQADSRDNALKLSKEAIQRRIELIARANAQYAGIGMPYSSNDPQMMDAAFRWISSARESGLNIIWRSSLPQWEGMFGAPHKPDPQNYPRQIYAFIATYPEFFEPGDMFDPCAEAENELDVYSGNNRYVYRKFLADTDKNARQAFHAIGKDSVIVIHSMNGDVPQLLGYDQQDGMNIIKDVFHNNLYLDWSPYNYESKDYNPQTEHAPYDLAYFLARLRKLQDQFGARLHLTETGINLSEVDQHVQKNHLDDSPRAILALQNARVEALLSGLEAIGVRGIQFYALDNKDSSLVTSDLVPYPSYTTVQRRFDQLKGKQTTTSLQFSRTRRGLLTGRAYL